MPAVQGHMTETLRTFVGARLAVDKERSGAVVDMSAEDDALVSLLAGAGMSDSSGRAHFVQALREHLLASGSQASDSTASAGAAESTSKANLATTGHDDSPADLEDRTIIRQHSIKEDTEPSKTPHAHGISSHGHRAFLIDDSHPATISADKT